MRSKIFISAIVVFCLAFSSKLTAQTENNLGSYLYYHGLINPAAVGSELLPTMNIGLARKWVGFPGAASFQSMNGSFRVGKLDFYNPKMFINESKVKISDRIGLGLAMHNYSSGILRNQYAGGTYSYHVPLGSSVLSFGLSIAYEHKLVKESDFIPFQSSDPIIDFINESYHRLTTHTGIFWYSKKAYAGLSTLNLVDVVRSRNPESYQRQYWLIAGYYFDLNRSWTLEPVIALSGNESPAIAFDIGARMHYNSDHWLSINYNSKQQIHTRIAISAGRIHILYAFGFDIQPIASYQFGTHEIGIGFNPALRKRTGNN